MESLDPYCCKKFSFNILFYRVVSDNTAAQDEEADVDAELSKKELKKRAKQYVT